MLHYLTCNPVLRINRDEVNGCIKARHNQNGLTFEPCNEICSTDAKRLQNRMGIVINESD